MNNNYYAVIMAGGVGTRFWPVSTQNFPKQFHDMLGTGNSLLQQTFSRFEKLIPSNQIFISTNKKYKKIVLSQLNNTQKEQLILEPAMRNTAPSILYAAFKIYKQNPNGIMIVAPSDHFIENEDEFLKNVETSFEACKSKDILMTLGIKPSSPNTGYGYIQFDKNKEIVKKVKQFTEKPVLSKAKKFIKSGDYLWNAGIFIWNVKAILSAFKTYLPYMFELFEKGSDDYNTLSELNFIEANYSKSENISIDFGILEKAKNVFVIPVDFGWNDLGTWGSLYDKLPKDNTNNAVVGAKTIMINSQGNMIKTSKGKHVIIQGLNDFIVVENEDVLLICPKINEQDIKQIVKATREKFGENIV